MKVPWSDDRTEQLRRLVSCGLTDIEIAEALGVSLRAAIGKRQREGLRVNNRRLGGVLIRQTLPPMKEEDAR